MAKSEPERLTENARDPQELFDQLASAQKKMLHHLVVQYTNSRGEQVALTLAEIEKRLFALSFDPNHPPELRWGAAGKELGSAPRDQRRFYEDYQAQRFWRYRLERSAGEMHPSDDDNPRSAPEHDISAMIERLDPSGPPRANRVRRQIPSRDKK